MGLRALKDYREVGYADPDWGRKYHAANRDARNKRSREYHYLAKYGLTPAAYDALLASQGGRCAACSSTDPASQYGRFHVDHDHATHPRRGTPRGLLCAACNRAIGHAKESAARLRACAAYLDRVKT